jgi:hypothetical protein
MSPHLVSSELPLETPNYLRFDSVFRSFAKSFVLTALLYNYNASWGLSWLNAPLDLSADLCYPSLCRRSASVNTLLLVVPVLGTL